MPLQSGVQHQARNKNEAHQQLTKSLSGRAEGVGRGGVAGMRSVPLVSCVYYNTHTMQASSRRRHDAEEGVRLHPAVTRRLQKRQADAAGAAWLSTGLPSQVRSSEDNSQDGSGADTAPASRRTSRERRANGCETRCASPSTHQNRARHAPRVS